MVTLNGVCGTVAPFSADLKYSSFTDQLGAWLSHLLLSSVVLIRILNLFINKYIVVVYCEIPQIVFKQVKLT